MLPAVPPEENAGALERADDAFLVARAQDGDVRAFGAILKRHERSLQAYVGRLTRNAADTDDVLQETAIIAWRRLDTIEDPSKVRAWLLRIATREAIRTVSGRPVEDELPDETTLPAKTDGHPERVCLREELRAALDALPQQQARCWVLRELGGYSYSEISERLGIPESTVRGSLAAARKSLLARMGGRR
jgi:RNA polymerase sigma-70 factor, ECF subfamily